MVSACLLLVWPGHVRFALFFFGQWSGAWPVSTVQFVVRLLKLLFVCVLECLGYVAQLLGVTGIQFEMPLPGVVWTWSH